MVQKIVESHKPAPLVGQQAASGEDRLLSPVHSFLECVKAVCVGRFVYIHRIQLAKLAFRNGTCQTSAAPVDRGSHNSRSCWVGASGRQPLDQLWSGG